MKYYTLEDVRKKNVKAVVYSDLHIKERHGAVPYLPAVRQVVGKVVELAEEFEVPTFSAGDTFDKAKPTPPEIRSFLVDALRSFSHTSNDNYIISGNHVKSRLDRDDIVSVLTSGVEGFIDSVKHCDKPLAVTHDDITYHLWPYGPEMKSQESFEKALGNFRKEAENAAGKYQVLVSHFATKESLSGMGHKIPNGLALTADMLGDSFDFVILGDYHRPQVVVDSPRVEYVGAPSQLSFGDEFPGCVGFLVKDGDTLRMLRVKTRDLVDDPSTLPLFRTFQASKRNAYCADIGMLERICDRSPERVPENHCYRVKGGKGSKAYEVFLKARERLACKVFFVNESKDEDKIADELEGGLHDFINMKFDSRRFKRDFLQFVEDNYEYKKDEIELLEDIIYE